MSQLFSPGAAVASLAAAATTTIPIVFICGEHRVRAGLVYLVSS
jgi:hypothetical protein